MDCARKAVEEEYMHDNDLSHTDANNCNIGTTTDTTEPELQSRGSTKQLGTRARVVGRIGNLPGQGAQELLGRGWKAYIPPR